jgi:hypothetical protein
MAYGEGVYGEGVYGEDAGASEPIPGTPQQEGYASVAELIGYDSIYHDRTSYAEVAQQVALVATSTREGYSSVAELIGYDSFYQDRTSYAEVAQEVSQTAVSTREGYALVEELVGYDSTYQDRTSYAEVAQQVGLEPPEFTEIIVGERGWGVRMEPARVLVYKGEGYAEVVQEVGIGA